MRYEFFRRWENIIRRQLDLPLRTRPVTLPELYQTLPDNEAETRIDALRTWLHKAGYRAEPEVKPKVKLRLFENLYNRRVLKG